MEPRGLQQKTGIIPDLCTLAKILTGGLPGGALVGKAEFMEVMEHTGDSHHDRFERVSHGGTFNANPYCAATGSATLKIVATGEMQAQADRMAERIKGGLREIMDQREVAACVYGDSSTFHVYFGSRSIEGMDATWLKSQSPEVQTAFKHALQVRGVDPMSRCSGVLSGVHTEADVDSALEVFDGATEAMLNQGLIQHG